MVGPRRRSREIALQVLHQIDLGGAPVLDAKQMIARYFAHLASESAPVTDEDDEPAAGAPRVDHALVEELVAGVTEHRAEIDGLLAGLSRNWRLERMASSSARSSGSRFMSCATRRTCRCPSC